MQDYQGPQLIGITPSGQLHHDTQRSSTFRDLAKTHVNPDSNGNSINPLAVSRHTVYSGHIDPPFRLIDPLAGGNIPEGQPKNGIQ